MKTIFIGKNCIRLEKIPSTNSFLAGLSQNEKLPEGTLVIANCQEQGRGQRGTSWNSESGKNLTLSVLLKPVFLPPHGQFGLSKAISLAVADFIRHCLDGHNAGEAVKIKWPNDIYIADKKVAGMLIENSVSGSSVENSVVGIGINVNQEKFPEPLPNPVSLKLITGKEFNLDDCLEQLCFYIERRYLQLKSNARETDNAYLTNLYRYNSPGQYLINGKKMTARITGITKTGKLVLETGNADPVECDLKEIECIL